jgi:tetrapyrrole methylase family protein/MazG family protein
MILIVGLGQGVRGNLTIEARQILEKSNQVFIRSKEDPAINLIPDYVTVKSFDEEYKSAKGRQVYKRIAEDIINFYKTTGEAVYCVPGHPFVGETSVNLICNLAKENGIAVRIIPGISFIDAVAQSLNVDPLDGMEILTSEELILRSSLGVNPRNNIIISMLIWPISINEIGSALDKLYPPEHIVYLVERAGTSEEVITELRMGEVKHFYRLPHPLSCLYIPKCNTAYTIYNLFDDIQRMYSSNLISVTGDQKTILLLGGFESLDDFVKVKKEEMKIEAGSPEEGFSERIRWDLVEEKLGEYLMLRMSTTDIKVADIESHLRTGKLNKLEKIILKKLMKY